MLLRHFFLTYRSPISHFLQPFAPKALLCQSWLCWVVDGDWLPSSGLPQAWLESTCHGQTARSSPTLSPGILPPICLPFLEPRARASFQICLPAPRGPSSCSPSEPHSLGPLSQLDPEWGRQMVLSPSPN